MRLIAKHMNFKLFIICVLFVAGCHQKTSNHKLYLRNIENPDSDERTFQVDEDFDYDQILFKLYFIEDSGYWELVETYKFDKNNSNTFTTGYNHWTSNNILYCDSQLYLIYEDKKFEHTAVELENYEKQEGYDSCGGYRLVKNELSYNETPFYMKSIGKTSYINSKNKYSISHNWKDYKIENMNMSDYFNCEGYSCYVYTVQLIH